MDDLEADRLADELGVPMPERNWVRITSIIMGGCAALELLWIGYLGVFRVPAFMEIFADFDTELPHATGIKPAAQFGCDGRRDKLARSRLFVETFEQAEALGDPDLIEQVSKTLGETSPTLQEGFNTAIRYLRAEARAKAVIQSRLGAR